MNDAVHIEKKIVEFDTVRVRFGEIGALALSGLLLDHVQDRERVSIGKPSIESWDSHGASLSISLSRGPRQKSPK